MTRMRSEGVHEIERAFDKTLTCQFVRLTGAGVGINELAFTVPLITCVVLLGEREQEVGNGNAGIEGRYSEDSLLEELKEIGVSSLEDLRPLIGELREKGYVSKDDEGRLVAERPLTSTTRLLDLIFQKMKGMNLVFYLMQIYGEVLAGRKTLEQGLSSLDQTFNIHGVVLKKQIPSKRRVRSPEKTVTADPNTDERLVEELKKTLARRRLKTRKTVEARVQGPPEAREAPLEQRAPSVSASPRPSAGDMPVAGAGKKPSRGGDAAVPGGAKGVAPGKGQGVSQSVSEDAISAVAPPSHEPRDVETGAVAATKPEPLQPGKETRQGRPVSSIEEAVFPGTEERESMPAREDTAPLSRDDMGSPVQPDRSMTKPSSHGDILREESETEVPGETDPVDDSFVDERVAALSDSLGLVCPLCNKGGLRLEKTVAGRLFYRCSESDCTFISWGRPHFIQCPSCKSPFLVETVDAAGGPVLECVNASCYHRQRPPDYQAGSDLPPDEGLASKAKKTGGTKRRVVRKRVVRRKR
jgi:hypothetical protein